MDGSRTLVAVAVTALLCAGLVAPAAAATGPSLTVALADDGSAEVTVVSTYDLGSESEQQAFDDLRTNETLQSVYTGRLRDRWQGLVRATEATTGREMALTDVSLSLSRDGSTGVATVTAAWDGLAATSDGRLTLSAPFTDEYTPDRRFVVVLPDGYAASSVTPEPDSSSGGRLEYAAGTDLSGFELVAEPSASIGGSGPGFGALAALAAVAAAALVALARR